MDFRQLTKPRSNRKIFTANGNKLKDFIMMQLLKAISWTAGVLYILFQTTAVYEYLKIMPLPEKIKKMKEYQTERQYNYSLSYRFFYTTNYNSFLIRLLTCPYCLGAWLSIGFSWVFSCIEWFPVVYLSGLSTYYGATVLLKWLEKVESNND
jgi:hypothetical protein